MKTVIEAINELIANYALPEEVVSTLTDYVNAISGGTTGNNGRKQIGLVIKTVTGKTITVTGTVEYKSEYNCFYCGGESFPAEIVCAIITEDTEKHRADVAEEALSLAFDEWTCCDLCMFSFDCKTNRTDCKKAEISKIKQQAEARLKELKEEV